MRLVCAVLLSTTLHVLAVAPPPWVSTVQSVELFATRILAGLALKVGGTGTGEGLGVAVAVGVDLEIEVAVTTAGAVAYGPAVAVAYGPAVAFGSVFAFAVVLGMGVCFNVVVGDSFPTRLLEEFPPTTDVVVGNCANEPVLLVLLLTRGVGNCANTIDPVMSAKASSTASPIRSQLIVAKPFTNTSCH